MIKGIIYEIYIDSQPHIKYVGSTIKTLEKRWKEHKKDWKLQGQVISIYKYFEEFDIDNFQIRVIKEYDVIDSKHLKVYEQLWIYKLKPINIHKTIIKNLKNLYICNCSPNKKRLLNSKIIHEKTQKHKNWIKKIN